METKNFKTELYQLKPGECFVLDDEVFMESDEETGDGDFWCMRLRDGMIRHVPTWIKVTPIKTNTITIGDVIIEHNNEII